MLFLCTKHTCKKNEKIQLLCYFFGRVLGKNYDFTCFGRKIKINQDLVGMLWNFTDPLYVFLDVSAKKKVKIQFLGRCFDFMSFRRVKNSFLIRPLSENYNFL